MTGSPNAEEMQRILRTFLTDFDACFFPDGSAKIAESELDTKVNTLRRAELLIIEVLQSVLGNEARGGIGMSVSDMIHEALIHRQSDTVHFYVASNVHLAHESLRANLVLNALANIPRRYKWSSPLYWSETLISLILPKAWTQKILGSKWRPFLASLAAIAGFVVTALTLTGIMNLPRGNP